MRFGPEDEDLSHHTEQFFSVRVRAGQPPCSKTHTNQNIRSKHKARIQNIPAGTTAYLLLST